eukprot:15472-Lingulodinium_polyedra.AAC.1
MNHRALPFCRNRSPAGSQMHVQHCATWARSPAATTQFMTTCSETRAWADCGLRVGHATVCNRWATSME